MVFTNPHSFWLFVLLPALIIATAILAVHINRERTRFAIPALYDQLTRSRSTIRRTAGTTAQLFGIAFAALALTGPRFGTRTEIVTRMGVDIVIAIDTSTSMLAEDIKPNRMTQAKYEINRLIDNLQGDRIALVAFSGNAIIQCPLTTDYSAAKTFLEYIDVGVVPTPGTNIGEAIDASVKLFERGSDGGSQSQLIILFTDGESLSGDPEKTAKTVASDGIRIYTVGIGTDAGEIIPIRDEGGQVSDYKRDSSGNVVTTRLDGETLRTIADITGGSYLHTENGEVDIQSIIDELGSLHKSDIHERKISRLRERYQLPLGVSLAFFAIWLLAGDRVGSTFRFRRFADSDGRR